MVTLRDAERTAQERLDEVRTLAGRVRCSADRGCQKAIEEKRQRGIANGRGRSGGKCNNQLVKEDISNQSNTVRRQSRGAVGELMATVRELLRAGEDLPTGSARRDAEILLSHCLGKPRAWLYTWPEQTVLPECASPLRRPVVPAQGGSPGRLPHRRARFLDPHARRQQRHPHPASRDRNPRGVGRSSCRCRVRRGVLDLGTGCGAIALALASERRGWRVAGADASVGALEVARANGVRTGLQRVAFFESNWYQAIGGQRFDLLLANPPYIDGGDEHLARGDLRFEPPSALVSGGGGLDDLRALVAGAPRHLEAGGWLLLEHGFAQGDAVREMLCHAGFVDVETRRDLAGNERATGGRWHAD